jgi:hypothetical protein
MSITTASWRGIGLSLLALFSLGADPVWSTGAEPEEPVSLVTQIDLDECDPITLRNRIMEASPERGTLVVAEREVRGMDVQAAERRIRTIYLGIAGKPEPRGSFRAGEYVRVEGYLHPDGYIAASSIQKIDKPVEKKARYKPVERSKKMPRKIRNAGGAP